MKKLPSAFGGKTKIFASLACIFLLSAACGSPPPVAGVAKTVNGGTDWQLTNAIKNSKQGSLQSLNISKLAFDPASHQIVYAGSYSAGIYKSEDSGATWTNILSNLLVYDFVINPINPKEIYAAGFLNDHGRVLKTEDGGGSWQEVFNEASLTNPVRSIALNSAVPSQLVIGLASGNVVRSFDGGLSWKLSNNFGDQVNRVLWTGSNIYVLLKTKGLFVTEDNQDNYSELTSSLTNNSIFKIFVSGLAAVYSQAYVDPVSNNLIYLTSSRGLFKSVDAGKTWSSIALPVKTADAYARGIAVFLQNSSIVYTNVGNTVYKSLDAGNTWQTQDIAATGFINYILIDPQLPQIVYAGIYASQ